MPLAGKNQPKLESKYMPMSFQTHQKSDNSPLPDKTVNSEGEGRTTACKTYPHFFSQIFDCYLIPPIKYV